MGACRTWSGEIYHVSEGQLPHYVVVISWLVARLFLLILLNPVLETEVDEVSRDISW